MTNLLLAPPFIPLTPRLPPRFPPHLHVPPPLQLLLSLQLLKTPVATHITYQLNLDSYAFKFLLSGYQKAITHHYCLTTQRPITPNSFRHLLLNELRILLMVIQVTEFAPLRFKANLGKDDAPFIITLHGSHDLYLCL